MINLTFASFKQHKEPLHIKQQISKKHEMPLTSFKAIAEHKDSTPTVPCLKKLVNQENTFNNIQSTTQPRKNMVKVDKSSKKYQTRAFKSPLGKHWEETSQSETVQNKIPMKIQIQSKYLKGTSTSRNEHAPFPTMMTPNLNKNNNSITVDELNASFLTQKHSASMNSDHGSVSSNKNSFNDSFQLYPSNISIEEDHSLRGQNVNSSMQIFRDTPYSIKDFSEDSELKNMKKSHYCFNNGESVLKQLDLQSNASAASITSMKFSQKFKHYKKRTQTVKKSISSIDLSNFNIIQEIGSGKYGKVFLAIHLATGFICAIKSISKKLIKEEHLQQALIRQIKIQFFLNHPNLVKLYGIFHDNSNTYLIMEYCSGNHLHKKIQEQRQFSQAQALLVLTNVFESVSYLHCNGIIHRDIKPQNIVIQHGTYKLCDFGWAAYACGDTRTTFCGTPLYVCPQVLKGEEYNEKADIWGLGIVAYELLFGRVPFPILTQNDMMKIIKDPVYFPFWNQTSEKMIPFVKQMLNKDPSQRPSLNQMLSSQPLSDFKDSFDLKLKEQFKHFFAV